MQLDLSEGDLKTVTSVMVKKMKLLEWSGHQSKTAWLADLLQLAALLCSLSLLFFLTRTLTFYVQTFTCRLPRIFLRKLAAPGSEYDSIIGTSL